MTITMTRDDLLEKLAEVLKEAQAEDAKVTAKHEAQEINALKLFRAKVRKALDWDYAAVKDKNFGVSLEHDFRPDRCPQRQAAPIERMIRDIKLDQRKKDSYQFGEGSDIHIAVTWRPESKRIKDSVCD